MSMYAYISRPFIKSPCHGEPWTSKVAASGAQLVLAFLGAGVTGWSFSMSSTFAKSGL